MGQISQLQGLGLGFAGLSAISSGLAGYGQYESGQQQKAAYDYNADITLQNMQDEMQTSEAKYSNLIGKQASAYARAGVDIASGSPLLMMAHTAAQNAKEQEGIRRSGTEEAALQRYYGAVAAYSGTVGGVNTFLTGLSKAGLNAATIMS